MPRPVRLSEVEWLGNSDQGPMLRLVRKRLNAPTGAAAGRRLRLFACACVRRVWGLIDEGDGRRAVEVAERYADGQATAEELEDAYVAAAGAMGPHVKAGDPRRPRLDAVNAARLAACPDVWETRWAAYGSAGAEWGIPRWSDIRPEWQRPLCDLLREVFGNPFRPPVVDARLLAWNDGIIAKIGRAIYEERAFDRLPILADALLDAGCADASLLDHLRGPVPHARGCFAVDAVRSVD
jgi:hypothetical protein